MSTLCPQIVARLDDILVTATGTLGAAVPRFIVARKDDCAVRYDVLLARSVFSKEFFQNIYVE